MKTRLVMTVPTIDNKTIITESRGRGTRHIRVRHPFHLCAHVPNLLCLLDSSSPPNSMACVLLMATRMCPVLEEGTLSCFSPGRMQTLAVVVFGVMVRHTPDPENSSHFLPASVLTDVRRLGKNRKPELSRSGLGGKGGPQTAVLPHGSVAAPEGMTQEEFDAFVGIDTGQECTGDPTDEELCQKVREARGTASTDNESP
ncbi:Hypp8191 [Branchiostoma lanceolatum]|uniref:Hypp8191 protein n=1 Tax=Branchiostoma lanceolatum TaxID=7740 RepID=A0A8K0ED35_BRALA|nr:Hypp8191 [Branchiostoma lanceolatum]